MKNWIASAVKEYFLVDFIIDSRKRVRKYFEIAKITDVYFAIYEKQYHCADDRKTGCRTWRKRGEEVTLECCPYCGSQFKYSIGRFLMKKTYNWSKFRGMFNVETEELRLKITDLSPKEPEASNVG